MCVVGTAIMDHLVDCCVVCLNGWQCCAVATATRLDSGLPRYEPLKWIKPRSATVSCRSTAPSSLMEYVSWRHYNHVICSPCAVLRRASFESVNSNSPLPSLVFYGLHMPTINLFSIFARTVAFCPKAVAPRVQFRLPKQTSVCPTLSRWWTCLVSSCG